MKSTRFARLPAPLYGKFFFQAFILTVIAHNAGDSARLLGERDPGQVFLAVIEHPDVVFDANAAERA